MNDLKIMCEEFSKGNFSACYEYFAADIRWKIVGDQTVSGKSDMTAFCDKMKKDMDSAVLHNINIIEQGNNMAIEGYCSYTNEKNEPARVEYCDVYECKDGRIQTITSYCITSTLRYQTV